MRRPSCLRVIPFLSDEQGLAATEYAVLLVVLIVVCLLFIPGIATYVGNIFSSIATLFGGTEP